MRYTGTTNWIFLAAPCLMDVLTYLLFFCICMWGRFWKKWVWLNLVIIGMISPLVNSFYNYWGSEGGSNDVGRLFDVCPRGLIHTFFAITLFVYMFGLGLVFLRSKAARARKMNRAAVSEGGLG